VLLLASVLKLVPAKPLRVNRSVVKPLRVSIADYVALVKYLVFIGINC